jgi:hypothetical protein
MSNRTLEDLRAAVADDNLPVAERRIAAEHYIAALVDSVPEPGPDDPEVIELKAPWKSSGNPDIDELYAYAHGVVNEDLGWDKSGPTVAQAKTYIREQRKFQALLVVAADEMEPCILRLAACRAVLNDLDPRSAYRRNGHSAQQMLDAIKPLTATKWEGMRKVPVSRPPKGFTDLWEV